MVEFLRRLIENGRVFEKGPLRAAQNVIQNDPVVVFALGSENIQTLKDKSSEVAGDLLQFLAECLCEDYSMAVWLPRNKQLQFTAKA